MNVCGLGLGVGTGDMGILGKIIEVRNRQEFENLGMDNIKGKIGKDALFIDSQINLSMATNIAFLGLNKLKKKEEDDISTLSPFYLRKSEAEIVWEKKYK